MKLRVVIFFFSIVSNIANAQNDSSYLVEQVGALQKATDSLSVHSDYLIIYDSLFSTETGKTNSEIYEPRIDPDKNDYQLALLLLAMLIYITWITFTYRKEFRENLVVMTNNGLGQQIYRDREFSSNIFRLLTFINFIFIFGLLIDRLMRSTGTLVFFDVWWLNMGVCVGAIAMAYLCKGIIYRLIAVLYDLDALVRYFRFNSLVIYQMLGIGLFPLMTLALFAGSPVDHWALVGAVTLAGLAFLLRIIRGISLLGMLKHFHFLYFLLYICALEIAPVLILIRLISREA